MTTTNYNNIIPKGVLFNLAQLQGYSIIKTPTAKKLIYAGKLEAIKISNKLHVSRAELIRYLEDKTVKVNF
jgi:hypothetical protein